MNPIVKRSVAIRGHRTSISLEQPFFDELAAIAAARRIPLAALVAEIDENRPRNANLSSAIRLHVLAWVKRGGDAEYAAHARLDDRYGGSVADSEQS